MVWGGERRRKRVTDCAAFDRDNKNKCEGTRGLITWLGCDVAMWEPE